MLGVGKGWVAAAVIEDHTEKLIILLVKAVQACLQIVSSEIDIKTDLASGIGRCPVVRRGNRRILRRAVVVGVVVVVERRNCQQGL